jgi:addiction module HigA family antidote
VNFFAETLRETLDEWDVSQAEVSRMTGIPSPHLTDMKKSRRRCTPEYDLRFSRYFGTSPGFWLRLQLDYDLMRAARENGERIEREVQPHAA